MKHVDVPAVLDVADCHPLEVPVQSPDGPCCAFQTPIPDFALARVELAGARRFLSSGPEIVLCTSGSVSVAGHLITGGGAVWVPAAAGEYEVAGEGLVFRARTGVSGV